MVARGKVGVIGDLRVRRLAVSSSSWLGLASFTAAIVLLPQHNLCLSFPAPVLAGVNRLLSEASFGHKA